jgi:hypothetical protein
VCTFGDPSLCISVFCQSSLLHLLSQSPHYWISALLFHFISWFPFPISIYPFVHVSISRFHWDTFLGCLACPWSCFRGFCRMLFLSMSMHFRKIHICRVITNEEYSPMHLSCCLIIMCCVDVYAFEEASSLAAFPD